METKWFFLLVILTPDEALGEMTYADATPQITTVNSRAACIRERDEAIDYDLKNLAKRVETFGQRFAISACMRQGDVNPVVDPAPPGGGSSITIGSKTT
jgi:hypothetical protein